MEQDEILQIASQLSGDDVCAEILALSVVEFSHTPKSRITLDIDSTKGVLRDTGRGMRLTPDRGDTLSHAERALIGHYPCLPSNDVVGTVLSELIWGARGSLGPSVANFACKSYRFTSMRDGEIWSQLYQGGRPTGPATMLGLTEESGTRVEFETERPIDASKVKSLVHTVCGRIKGLSISLRHDGTTY
ncbi:DNA gyrase/topoisomerase IV subunit B [Pararobbsia alpina]|uniref:hypothetical protein n=1 Tax=Pararobbsia alpina TaxID=621374 RepID=UPI0039A66F07